MMFLEDNGRPIKYATLLSGGMDSSTLLYSQLTAGQVAVTVDYGQSHRREIDAAARLCEMLDVDHVIVKISGLAGGSLLGRDGSFVGDDTVVPGRNGILIGVAVNVAAENGCNRISIGCNKNDRQTYKDCRSEYLQSIGKSIAMSTGIRLCFPFASMSKGEVRELGKRLGVPFEDTWSCYRGLEEPCGKCGACIEVGGSREISD